MSPTATAKPAVPSIAEVLQPEDLKVIDLVRASLGERAAERTKLVILKERAARVVKVTEEDLAMALGYARNDRKAVPEMNKGRAAFQTLARKFILEDKSILHRFESFGRTLLDTNGIAVSETPHGKFVCPECGRDNFTRGLGLAIHRNKMHGVAGEFARSHGKRRKR